MKQTLSTGQAANILSGNTDSGFSYQGARALIEYLEEIENGTGEEMGLDCVAIRCDWSEYGSIKEWASYFWGPEFSQADCDEDGVDAIRKVIQDNGTLIEFSGGVIVSSF